MENIIFNDWPLLLRTFIMTITGYFGMVFILRSSGKRTLSKMNAFDFIITVALGSSLASVALSTNIPLSNGILAFFLLIFLQFIITFLSARVPWVKHLVTSQPSLILYRGKIIPGKLKKERITKEELYLAARKKGLKSLQEIEAVVLETTGDLTIITSFQQMDVDTMQDVNTGIDAP